MPLMLLEITGSTLRKGRSQMLLTTSFIFNGDFRAKDQSEDQAFKPHVKEVGKIRKTG